MGTIRYVIFQVILSCLSTVSLSQTTLPELPEINLKNEKFSTVKDKLEEYFNKVEYGDFDFKKSLSESEDEDESPVRQLKYWMGETQSHLDENGMVFNYPAKNWEEYLKQTGNIANGSVSKVATATSGEWQNLKVNTLTPSNWGHGRTNCLAIDPTNNNTMYAGAIEGGLWKTSDGGLSWYCITSHLPIPAVNSIVIDPNNTNTIFILTGAKRNNFFTDAGKYSLGAFVTYDGGINWYQTGLKFTAGMQVTAGSLRMSPLNSNILIAGTSNGIYTTTDGGLTWPFAQLGLFNDIEFKPGTGTCYASTNNSVYKSTDEGASWIPITAAAFPLFNPTPSNSKIVEIAVTPASPGVVYLYFYGGSAASIYKSNNSGVNFTFMSSVTVFANNQPGYSSSLAVSPTNGSTLFLGNFGVYRSQNSGLNFDSCGTGIHVDQHDMIAMSNTEIYAANDGGIYKTTTGGASWSFISTGINDAAYIGFGGYPGNAGLFYGGTWDNGVFKYSGDTLSGINNGDRGDCLIKANDPNTFYFTLSNAIGELYRIIAGNPPDNITPFYGCSCADSAGGGSSRIVTANPLNPNTIYATYRDLYISYNGGTNWTRKTRGSTTASYTMAQGTNDTTRFYVLDPFQIWCSADYGNTWPSGAIYNHPNNISNNLVDVCVNPNNKNEFYFCCSGYMVNDKMYKGVWTGNNNAPVITNISTGLPNVPVYKVIYQNTSTPGIYAGTEIGVYFRSDASGVWEYFGGGFPVARITDLEINYGSNVITAATYGHGLWQSPLYSGCPTSFNHGNYYFLGFPYAFPTVAGQEYFEASDNIHSSVLIQGGAGVDVTYNAGNYVLLSDSFEVKEGSVMTAKTGGCNSPQPQPKGIGDFAGDINGLTFEATDSNSETTKLQLDAYPSPASENLEIYLNLDSQAETEIVLLDITGRKLKSVLKSALLLKGVHHFKTDITNVNNGMYLLRVKTNNNVTSKKIVVYH